jgi:hypothetical protein
MPEDYKEPERVKGNAANHLAFTTPNEKHAIRYTAGDAVSEKRAYRAVALKIVELLPRSETFEPSLSRNHSIEARGIDTLRATVVANDPFQNAVLEAVQNSVTDLTWAGRKVHLKTTETRHRGSHRFNLKHGRDDRPYDLDCGLAFALVVVDCARFYYFSKEDPIEQHLVGKGTKTSRRLPHPNECALDSKNE